MRIRVRGPNGVSTLTLPAEATVGELRSQISAKTALPSFELKRGYPPQALDLDQFDDGLTLSDTGLRLDGEQVMAIKRDVVSPLVNTVPDPPRPAPNDAQPRQPFSAAGAASPAASQPPQASTSVQPTPAPPLEPRPAQQRPPSPSTDPPEIPLPTHSATLLLRVMPDDNSCLFRAVASAVLGPLASHDTVHELRALVAARILAEPELYTSAVLDNKSPAAYCTWITRDDAWGGAIELGILAQQFDVEIASVNVQDLRVDRFNEGARARAILVYSGIHYDVVATSPSEPPHSKADVPAELDVRVFDASDDGVLEAALELCRQLRSRHYYTDTAGFEVRCNICGWRGKGERGATKHAKETGHMDFGES